MTASKYLVLFYFLGYSTILALGLALDWQYVWSHTGFNFTSLPYPFADIRNVTNYNSFFELGLDPRVDKFTNSDGQIIPPFNYPSFWLLFSKLSNQHTIYFGLSFFILFSIGIYLSLKIRHNKDLIVYSSLLFSPVMALLIERGNNDQVAFFYVAIFCYFSKNNIVKLSAYYLAFAVKFFPLVIIASLADQINSKSIKLGFLILLPVFIYSVVSFPEIIDLGKATPTSVPNIGYGWRTYGLILSEHFNQVLLQLGSLLSIFAVFLFFIMIKPERTGKCFSNHELIMFKSGILIYIATYLVGTSFDYRLVFLLFTIPTLLKLNSRAAIMSTLLIVFLFWSHQLVYFSLCLSKYHIVFKILGAAVLAIKVIAHYALILLLIYNYRTIFEPVFFKWTLKNKI